MRIDEIRGTTIRLTLEFEDACVLVAALERSCYTDDPSNADFAACQAMACALEVAVFTSTLVSQTVGARGTLHVPSQRDAKENSAVAAA